MGHGRVGHGRVGHGRVAIRVACKNIVFLMNSRLVRKRNCTITRETKIAAIFWARSKFIEQTRNIVLLRMN